MLLCKCIYYDVIISPSAVPQFDLILKILLLIM
jgi:hypothetical protein